MNVFNKILIFSLALWMSTTVTSHAESASTSEKIPSDQEKLAQYYYLVNQAVTGGGNVNVSRLVTTLAGIQKQMATSQGAASIIMVPQRSGGFEPNLLLTLTNIPIISGHGPLGPQYKFVNLNFTIPIYFWIANFPDYDRMTLEERGVVLRQMAVYLQSKMSANRKAQVFPLQDLFHPVNVAVRTQTTIDFGNGTSNAYPVATIPNPAKQGLKPPPSSIWASSPNAYPNSLLGGLGTKMGDLGQALVPTGIRFNCDAEKFNQAMQELANRSYVAYQRLVEKHILGVLPVYGTTLSLADAMDAPTATNILDFLTRYAADVTIVGGLFARSASTVITANNIFLSLQTMSVINQAGQDIKTVASGGTVPFNSDLFFNAATLGLYSASMISPMKQLNSQQLAATQNKAYGTFITELEKAAVKASLASSANAAAANNELMRDAQLAFANLLKVTGSSPIPQQFQAPVKRVMESVKISFLENLPKEPFHPALPAP